MEDDGDSDGEGEVEEEGVGTPRALVSLEFLTHYSDQSGTTLVNARNGFNELSRLARLWTVRHCCPARVRFVFSCYRHWAQLIIRQPGEPPVTILIQDGVTQGDPLLIVLCGITLVPLVEELRPADLGLLSPFYADNAAFNGSARQTAQLIEMLMKRGPDRGYFPELA